MKTKSQIEFRIGVLKGMEKAAQEAMDAQEVGNEEYQYQLECKTGYAARRKALEWVLAEEDSLLNDIKHGFH